MKMTKRLSALLMAVLTVLCMFTMTACGDTSWSAKYGDETISAGVYPLAVMITYQNVYSQYGEFDLDAPMYTEADREVTVGEYIDDTALDTFKYYVAAKAMFEELGLTYSEKDYDACMAQSKAYYAAQSDLYKRNGISEASFNEFFAMNTLRIGALAEYYAEQFITSTSDLYLSESDYKDYFNEKYMRINYMLYMGVSDEGKYYTDTEATFLAEYDMLTNIAKQQLDEAAFAEHCKNYKDDYKVGEQPRRSGETNVVIAISEISGDTFLGDIFNFASGLEINASGATNLGFMDSMGMYVPGAVACQRLAPSVNEDDYVEYKGEIRSIMCSEVLFEDLLEYYAEIGAKENNSTVKAFSVEKMDLEGFTSVVPAK